MSRAPLLVWYDGACPLCAVEISLMRRLAPVGAIDFVDVSEEAACPIDRAELLARFHARLPDGRVVSGAKAFAAMWRRTPLLAPLGWIAAAPGLDWIFERLYRAFLRVRPRLQALLRGRAPAPALTRTKRRS